MHQAYCINMQTKMGLFLKPVPDATNPRKTFPPA